MTRRVDVKKIGTEIFATHQKMRGDFFCKNFFQKKGIHKNHTCVVVPRCSQKISARFKFKRCKNKNLRMEISFFKIRESFARQETIL